MRHLIVRVVLLVALWAPAMRAAAFETISWHGQPVAAGQALIVLSPAAEPDRALARLAAHGFTTAHIAGRDGIARSPEDWLARGESADADRYLLVHFPASRPLDDALADLATLDEVATVSPNQILAPFFTPNDPLYGQYQQNLRQIDLEAAWDRTLGAGVIVAVVDTGYASAGLDDAAKNVLAGYNFADNNSDVTDTDGHGTLVANVIAEATNNGVGTAGAAGDAVILPCKVFQNGGSGALESDVARAVDWSVKQGAKVINMSLGGAGYDDVAAGSMRDAFNANVVLAAATGNDGQPQVSYPAAYPDVIAVGSCPKSEPGVLPTRSSFSNYGQPLSVVAPGEKIYGETVGSQGPGVYIADGTSVACPHVAAAAALMIAASGGNYAAGDVRNALEQTANRPANTNWTAEIGWGEIDVANAMDALGLPQNQPGSGASTAVRHLFGCGIAPSANPLDVALIFAPLTWLLVRRRHAAKNR